MTKEKPHPKQGNPLGNFKIRTLLVILEQQGVIVSGQGSAMAQNGNHLAIFLLVLFLFLLKEKELLRRPKGQLCTKRGNPLTVKKNHCLLLS